ncbi:MAG: hypothetical protein ACXW5U_03515 [Thermoanaerobaculia bacterium]
MVIELRYRLRGEIVGKRLQGNVDAVITVLTVPALPRLADAPAARTGTGPKARPPRRVQYSESDCRLASAAALFRAMVTST